MAILDLMLVIPAALAVTATLVSLLPHNWWGVRVIDLLREPLNYTMVALLLLALAFGRGYRWEMVAALGAAIIVNYIRRWPYTRLARTQVALEEPPSGERVFTVMSANVLIENTQFDRMIEQVEKTDPDVLMMTEVDDKWAEAMAPMLERFDFVRSHPTDDTFGKIFASKLTVRGFDLKESLGEDTPTLRAVLEVGGRTVKFLGVHPEAPLPGHGEITDARDTSIIHAAQENDSDHAGSIVMGDFNDVPWSPPTAKARKACNWRDPRIGRGTFPTFPASWRPVGWPLDQLFVTDEVRVRGFSVLPPNGSDHRAMLGEFWVPG